MGFETLNAWLNAYGKAWENQDPDAAAALFTEDGTYAWGPFAEPITGQPAIRRAWETATQKNQAGIAFGYEPLAMTEDGRYIARWWSSMESVQTGQSVRMEGIFLITLAESGRCRVFREWWNEDPPATGASEFE